MSKLFMSNHNQRPVIDSTVIMRTSDAMLLREQCHEDEWNSKQHECCCTTSHSNQICFGRWSAAFCENDAALPPPKILVSRELRCTLCEKTVGAAGSVIKPSPYPSTRAWHNRCVGSMLLESKDKNRGQWTPISRTAEFETFLQDL